jgi:hypothetical protein
MGWLDNLWRRRQESTTDAERDAAEARENELKDDDTAEADILEEDAHRFRDEEIFREPRIPPGTG